MTQLLPSDLIDGLQRIMMTNPAAFENQLAQTALSRERLVGERQQNAKSVLESKRLSNYLRRITQEQAQQPQAQQPQAQQPQIGYDIISPASTPIWQSQIEPPVLQQTLGPELPPQLSTQIKNTFLKGLFGKNGGAVRPDQSPIKRSPPVYQSGPQPFSPMEELRIGLEEGQVSPTDFYSASMPKVVPKVDLGISPEEQKLITDYNEKFLPDIKPMLNKVKSNPAIVTDIAYLGEQMGLGKFKPYQDFINNIKGVSPLPQQNYGLKQSGQEFEQEQNLQNKFLAQTKDFRSVRDSYSQINTVAKDPSPAGDIALIFSFMKMQDPGSTVREGEFATAENAGSVPERIWSRYNRLMNGERLSQPIRDDFLNKSKALYGNSYKQAQKTEAQIRKLASAYGLNPDRVTMDLSVYEDPSASQGHEQASIKAYADPAKEARYQASLNPRKPSQDQTKPPPQKAIPVSSKSKEERYQDFLKLRAKR